MLGTFLTSKLCNVMLTSNLQNENPLPQTLGFFSIISLSRSTKHLHVLIRLITEVVKTGTARYEHMPVQTSSELKYFLPSTSFLTYEHFCTTLNLLEHYTLLAS